MYNQVLGQASSSKSSNTVPSSHNIGRVRNVWLEPLSAEYRALLTGLSRIVAAEFFGERQENVREGRAGGADIVDGL